MTRQERIEKLLHELEYEVTRGMMEREIAEELFFRFFVPSSSKIPNGVVWCEFKTRPTFRENMPMEHDFQPRLRVVKS